MSTDFLLSLWINVKKIRQTISHQQLSAFIFYVRADNGWAYHLPSRNTGNNELAVCRWLLEMSVTIGRGRDCDKSEAWTGKGGRNLYQVNFWLWNVNCHSPRTRLSPPVALTGHNRCNIPTQSLRLPPNHISSHLNIILTLTMQATFSSENTRTVSCFRTGADHPPPPSAKVENK
jgi:hypothetical protein